MSEVRHPGARGPLGLLRDRLKKHGWYDSAEYWNLKARSYAGIARSSWPSNRYNAETQRLQLETIERVLGDVSGKRFLDLGCGTGRIAIELEDRGAISFVPARYLLAFRDAPERLVKTLFWGGERLLASYPALAGLGDYKWHLYRVFDARPG